MKVCVGGTFNIFHKGHEELLDKAFETAGKDGIVYIGILVGEMLKNKKFAVPKEDREKEVKKYLINNNYEKCAVIKEIYDIYGLAVDMDVDAIVVSPESIKNAEAINNERIKTGKNPLKIIKIPFVLAQDNKPISSTRIHQGEINKEGKILKK